MKNQLNSAISSKDQSLTARNLVLINVYSALQGTFLSMSNLQGAIESVTIRQEAANRFNHAELRTLFSSQQLSSLLYCAYCILRLKNLTAENVNQDLYLSPGAASGAHRLVGHIEGSQVELTSLTARNLRLTAGGLLYAKGSELLMHSIEVAGCQVGNWTAGALRLLQETDAATTAASTSTAPEASQSVLLLETSNATLVGSTFSDNWCGGDLCAGGALQLKQCASNLENVTFVLNRAKMGGGLAMINPVSASCLRYLHFEQNAAAQMGGAILINSSLDLAFAVLVQDTVIKNNTSGYIGGGVLI